MISKGEGEVIKLKKWLYLLVIVVLLAFSGCAKLDTPTSVPYQSSFEDSMNGWVAKGTDLDNPPVEWSIERSQELASDGEAAIRLYLNNINDAGKIWVERSFDVEPNSEYQVHLEYDFASADWGDMNLWAIITGIVPKLPKAKDGLIYQEDTGNNARPEDGFVWLHKSYDFAMKSDQEGKLYIMIGVWGTWETARTYYLDNVNVTITSTEG